MITGDLKRSVDALWTEFWQGGITNPLTVIEQITFLIFIRLLDVHEARDQNRLARSGVEYKRRFNAEEQDIRWSQFRHLGGEAMLPLVRDRVFAHLRKTSIGATTAMDFMKDAQLMIQKNSLLTKAVTMIDNLPLTEGDTKGDLYEYLLSKLTTAGINGQFRTPRHVIKLMVELVMHEMDHGEPTWTVGDPACGTGGFLVAMREYLKHNYTSREGRIVEKKEDGEEVTYSEDLLEPYRKHVDGKMFCGFDFDVTMLRIASMNLMLHGVDKPQVHYQDTLSNSFPEKFKQYATDSFDVIFANPPFKGSLDHADVHSTLTSKVKTRKTELLFLVLMLRMLKLGGRCAVIVPDGVRFGSSNAHRKLREILVPIALIWFFIFSLFSLLVTKRWSLRSSLQDF